MGTFINHDIFSIPLGTIYILLSHLVFYVKDMFALATVNNFILQI